ncbi:hypothetical protein ILUMI_21475 [Ignelater luminosus]|uniref:CREB regulated transcription coactivator 1 n=1 Tax=Ignelater luminosus TaxID=2038154 RepID=A0A8K0CCC5_IGNLU|nr:hypothetical protein ILUMI_21475 [Ignelater luminosus]
MANPRKFSEKIALHTHRQAEETARFEQIMKEVSDATARPEDPTQQTIHSFREGRSRPQGGPMRRPPDRKHDHSPYSTSPFLSPPPDTSWRRTNSDSALHQSAMQGGMGVEKRNENSNSRWMLQTLNGPEQHDGRPRSCEVRVPGINIYPSVHEPGTIQIPIGNNTGSLPDLTSVHFPSPIHTPLDQDQDQGSSPYSSSPANTSPSTLSPTSVPPGVRQQGRFPFSGPPISQHQNHLSVPVNSRYLHHNKGVTLENNLIGLLDKTDYTQLGGMGAMYQQQIPPQSPSPTLQQPGYRSPRPSPQSSPGLGHHSAPCSPGAPSPLSNDYHLLNQHQANQLQQHFEQFSMVDQPLSPVSNVTYVDQPGSMHLPQTQSQTLSDIPGATNAELSVDAGYYSTSPSQLVYPTAPPSLHTTPNTPTSIPDIILTDFSTAEDIARQDLSLSKQIDVADLLSEESLREGLDLDGLQMLSDPTFNLITDGVEDHFRLDRS